MTPTRQCQQVLWRYVGNSSEFPEWVCANQTTLLVPFSFCCSVVFGLFLPVLSYISLSLSFYYLYLESTFSIRHHEFLELWVRRFSTSALARIVLITTSPIVPSLGSKRKQASKTKSTTSLPSKPLFLCYPYVTHMLVKGNFKTIIELPKYVDVNEWLAFNSKSRLRFFFVYWRHVASISFRVLQLYQHVLFIHHWFLQLTKLPFNVRRSRVSWHEMDGRDDGMALLITSIPFDSVEYTWSDAQSKKIKLPAPQYIDYMATSIENMLNDETIFPTKGGKMDIYMAERRIITSLICCYDTGREFPREFPTIVKRIFGQLFRLFAHIYHHHYDKILSLNEEPHFNSLFAHFISFAREFGLLDKKEIQPLQELVDIMIRNGVIS